MIRIVFGPGSRRTPRKCSYRFGYNLSAAGDAAATTSTSTTTTTNSLWFSTKSTASSRTPVQFYKGDDSGFDTASGRHRPTVLVVGSSGSLGRILSTYLSVDMNMNVIGADVVAPPPRSNDDQQQHQLHSFIEMPSTSNPNIEPPTSLADTTAALVDGLAQILDGDELSAIVCVAGGWEGDPTLPNADSTVEQLLDGARQVSKKNCLTAMKMSTFVCLDLDLTFLVVTISLVTLPPYSTERQSNG
jgi:hypothetical protein